LEREREREREKPHPKKGTKKGGKIKEKATYQFSLKKWVLSVCNCFKMKIKN
jgi:hypothetical protein